MRPGAYVASFFLHSVARISQRPAQIQSMVDLISWWCMCQRHAAILSILILIRAGIGKHKACGEPLDSIVRTGWRDGGLEEPVPDTGWLAGSPLEWTGWISLQSKGLSRVTKYEFAYIKTKLSWNWEFRRECLACSLHWMFHLEGAVNSKFRASQQMSS